MKPRSIEKEKNRENEKAKKRKIKKNKSKKMIRGAMPALAQRGIFPLFVFFLVFAFRVFPFLLSAFHFPQSKSSKFLVGDLIL